MIWFSHHNNLLCLINEKLHAWILKTNEKLRKKIVVLWFPISEIVFAFPLKLKKKKNDERCKVIPLSLDFFSCITHEWWSSEKNLKNHCSKRPQLFSKSGKCFSCFLHYQSPLWMSAWNETNGQTHDSNLSCGAVEFLYIWQIVKARRKRAFTALLTL